MNNSTTGFVAGVLALVGTAGCQVESTQPTEASAPVAAPAASAGGSSDVTAVPAFVGRVATASGDLVSRSGEKTTVALVAQARNLNGALHICGVYAAQGTGTRRFNSELAGRMSFFIDGQIVMSNMSFFAPASSIDGIGSTSPNCKSAGLPWQATYDTAPWDLNLTGDRTFGG